MLRAKFLQKRREAVEKALSEGRKIVIIGGQPGNVKQILAAEHPQVVWWSTESTSLHRELPQNTGLVLLTRFVDHKMTKRLYQQAVSRGADIANRVIQTGELRQVLAPILMKKESSVGLVDRIAGPIRGTEESNPDGKGGSRIVNIITSDTGGKKIRTGELKAFVEKNANLTAEIVAHEADRLVKLAEGVFNPLPTFGSMMDALRRVKMEAKWRERHPDQKPPTRLTWQKIKNVEPPATTAGTAATSAADETRIITTPVVAATIKATAPTPLDLVERLDQSIRLMRDAITYSTLVLDEIAHVRDEVVKNQEILNRLRSVKELVKDV
jgi:hypothetical protein